MQLSCNLIDFSLQLHKPYKEGDMEKNSKEILIDADIKITQARLSILEILLKSNSPMSYEDVKPSLPKSINKTTFYRNMSIFETKGIVNKFESQDRVWLYELTSCKHAHFMCDVCKKVICIDYELPLKIDDLQVKSITLKGKCKDCS